MTIEEILQAYRSQKRLPEPDQESLFSWIAEIEEGIWEILCRIAPEGSLARAELVSHGEGSEGSYSLPSDYASLRMPGAGLYAPDGTPRSFVLRQRERTLLTDAQEPLILRYKPQAPSPRSLSDSVLLSQKYLRYYLDALAALSAHDREDAQDQGAILWLQQVTRQLERRLIADLTEDRGVLHL